MRWENEDEEGRIRILWKLVYIRATSAPKVFLNFFVKYFLLFFNKLFIFCPVLL